MNSNLQHLVEFFIIAEFCIVILLVLITYIYRGYYLYRSTTREIRTAQINVVLQRIQTNQVIEQLPYSVHPHLLIYAFLAWDKTHKGSMVWNKNKVILMKDQILPNAIKYIHSADWIKRFWLLQCFEFYIDIHYEQAFISLINDSFSVISLGTTAIAMQYSTKAVINALIDKIYLAYPQFQKLYIFQLRANYVLYEVIKERLMTSEDSKLRILCYKILKQIGATQQFYTFAIHDVSSNSLELKLAAIRILADANPTAATLVLIELLKHKNWLVRNTAIRSMARLKKEDTIKYIAIATNDASWWVRVNAAKILANFGDEGRALLEISSKTSKLETYQEPMYFLKIHDLRETNPL